MKNKIIFDDINKVLSKWNPIGVPLDIAKGEYMEYIPIIIKCMNNKQKLHNCLISILVNDLGLQYSPHNIIQKGEVDNVCEKLYDIYIRNQ